MSKYGIRFLKQKTAAVLKNALEKGDPGLVELPTGGQKFAGKGCGASGKQFYQLSLADGCAVFLEAKYHMSRVSAKL